MQLKRLDFMVSTRLCALSRLLRSKL